MKKLHIFTGSTWTRWGLVALICLSPMVGSWVWSHRAEIAEAYEVAACPAPCAPLAPEELRLRVIKAYLKRQLDENSTRSYGHGSWRLALLNTEMTQAAAARSIREATLLALVTHDSEVLSKRLQIDSFNLSASGYEPTIVVYSLLYREVVIIPMQYIREASAAEVEGYFRAPNRRGPMSFSSWERKRGYGRHYFWITRWDMHLACCDGRGDFNGSPVEMNRRSLHSIQGSKPWLMAVSDHGNILVRYYDDEAFIYL